MRSLASTNSFFAVWVGLGLQPRVPLKVVNYIASYRICPRRSAAPCRLPIAVFQVPTHYAAIFRGGDNAYLQVVQLTDFDYSQASLSGTFLDSLKSASSEYHEIYDVPGGLVMSSVVFGHELCT